MRRVYLIRHAKSSWSNPELRDFDRPLNKRGKHDASFMSGLIREKGIHPDIIITSPAKRAFATALLFAAEFNFSEEKIIQDRNLYEARVKDILKVISLADENISNMMLFGHNPGLTDTINFISESYIDNVPTSGVVSLILNRESWIELGEKSCTLEFFEYPKRYYKED